MNPAEMLLQENQDLRRRRPNRRRLESRLRYLLTSEKDLAIWEDEASKSLCGFGRWKAERRQPIPVERMNGWREMLPDPPRGQSGRHPADLMSLLFERFGGPVEFDQLVGVVAQIWRVEDAPSAPEKLARDVESGDCDPSERIDLRRWMAELWTQIRELAAAERVALLMNLRAGDTAAVALLPLAGVASIRDIAQALELPAEEFAQIWSRLPLDDSAIAERLGVTQSTVLTLRTSARERLRSLRP